MKLLKQIYMQKYFLYARKSTDMEDKQILSIETQIFELKEFAKKENLNIVDIFIEKQTAKAPGRKIFGEMIKRIEKGEANGVLSWHPDRLARNSVDGGQIIYYVDIGKIVSLKFPSHWFENTPQGKFSLSMAFVQSKYYVDSLSENTKRGLRQKVRMGHFPSTAPIGYLNDPRTKTIVVDKKKSKIIQQAFQFYAKGDQRLEDVSKFLFNNNLKSTGSKNIHISDVTFILSNIFYTGMFKYTGEIHQGKHTPIISMKLFNNVQEVLKKRGYPDHKLKNQPEVYCGLISCGECRMMITCDNKTKKQLNGNIHHYQYYRCTKKSKLLKCNQSHLSAQEINSQISELILQNQMPETWAQKLTVLAKQEFENESKDVNTKSNEINLKISSLNFKLERLLNLYLEQDIEKENYTKQKNILTLEKKSFSEQILNLSHTNNSWLEPLQKWIKTADSIGEIANSNDFFSKKVIAKEIFGSNLQLFNKKLVLQNIEKQNALESPSTLGGNIWAALRASIVETSKKTESQILVLFTYEFTNQLHQELEKLRYVLAD